MARVLIVDDETSIRVTLKAFLAKDGHEVDAAVDVEEARQFLADGEYDVVVTDVILPQVSGMDLLKLLRQQAPYVQVIVMTGEPTINTAAEAVREGAADYLVKPVAKNAILRSVGNAARVKSLDDERRHLARENRRYQEELEELVEQRSGELKATNGQLQKALEDLRQAQNEIIQSERLNALAQMAAGICHDFNNVLMPIRGLTDYLVSHPNVLADREQTLRHLGHIHSATDDAKEIVRRMREFYRPRESMESAPVFMREIVADVVELTRPKWELQAQNEGRTIELVSRVDDMPPVLGNESQIREVFTNLVLNAVDAMPRGGTVTLTAEPSGREALLKVEDTGEGMTDEARQRCLEPFFTTKGAHGTGMGLAMVHGIVKRHSGSLDIESEIGKGTTILIRLPLWEQDVSVVEEDAVVCEEPRGGLRILVIDDEEWSRSLIAQYMSEAGHTVEVAADGATGVSMAASSARDIIITDRAMPGMNGDQVAAAIRRLAPRVGILMLTGDIITTHAGDLPDVDAVLEKPITQRELSEAVTRLASRKASADG